MSRKTGLGICALVAVAIGGCPTTAETVDSGPTTDSGADARVVRDMGIPLGDPFEAYQTGITAARTAECECRFMEDGFKNVTACVNDQLMNEDAIQCAEVGYNAARSASTASYRCSAAALAAYGACREELACTDSAAITECVTTVNAAIGTCPDLPTAATNASSACFQEMFIGTGVCPEAGAPWMGAGTFTGDTTLAGNEATPFDPVCFPDSFPAGMDPVAPNGLENSPDRSNRWIAPTPGTYTIDTVGTEFDTILYARAACANDSLTVACNDDIDTMAENVASRITVTSTTPNQEFIIVVDGFTTASTGPFTVNIVQTSVTPDAGPVDSGPSDAGPSDAGVDAGPVAVPDAFVAVDAPVVPDAPVPPI